MLGVLAAMLLFATPASDDTPMLPLDLQWEAPASCITRQQALADIERLTGTVVDGEARLRTSVRIVAADVGYRLTLTRSEADGHVLEERALEATECGVLARAATLMVAVADAPLRLSARLERTADRTAPVVAATPRAREDPTPESADPRPMVASERETEETRPRPRPAVERPQPSPPPSPRKRGFTHRFVAGGTAGLAVAVVPGPAPVFGGWAGYALGPLRFELSGEHVLARTASIDDGVAVQTSSSGGGALVVFAPRVSVVRVLFAAGFQAGVLRGSGTGARVSERDALDWWWAVPVVAGVAWPADSRIALRAQVELSVVARRPAIHIGSPQGDLGGFRRPPTALYARIGPEIRLP